MDDDFILSHKYQKLRIVKDDGTVVAEITNEDCNSATGYTIVLTPNYDYEGQPLGFYF